VLNAEENDLLTQVVGDDKPMGQLLRRYWHPIAPSAELDEEPTKAITVFGEDLVLFRNRKGHLGLVSRGCAHRRFSLVYGIPEDDGIRCSYHGWMYDASGACIDQPFEEKVHPGGRFKDKVRLNAYPVEELGGLVFAYFGPLPVPLLPRWEPLEAEGIRDIAILEIPCNWLQIQENSVDPVHAEWLHEYYNSYVEQRSRGVRWDQVELRRKSVAQKIKFDPFEYGIMKRKISEGGSEEDDQWRIGHPMVFPNVLVAGNATWVTAQWRVPMDDERTLHVTWYLYRPAPGTQVPNQDSVPFRYVPMRDETGKLISDYTLNQDFIAWETQGAIAPRELESLGESDTGIIMFREMLRSAIVTMQDGADPMNVFRDPAANVSLELPLERAGSISQYADLKYVPHQAGWSRDSDLIQRAFDTWKGEGAEDRSTPQA
jgi:5,5'-dehydrodivanillate O-demethylase